MSVVYSLGGLGNQLFAWAFAQWLKQTYGREVVIGTAFLKQSSGGHNSFASNLPEIWESLSYQRATYQSLIARVGLRMAHFEATDGQDWKRSNFFGVTEFMEVGNPEGYVFDADQPGHKYLGYYQTHRFYGALNHKPKLTNHEPSGNLQEGDSGVVSLHIRHGDYRILESTFGILPLSYYLDAIDRQRQYSPIETIKVFGLFDSESRTLIEKLEANFPEIEFDVSSLQERTDPHLELRQLSAIRRQILSNSSFAWWGSALEGNGHKIAPGHWFKGMAEPRDLIPDSWERIPFSWQ